MRKNIVTVFIMLCYALPVLSAPATVLVVHHSTMGHTRTMAEAVAKGAGSVEAVSVIVRNICEVKQEELLLADAVIVGSPVYNGNIHPKVMAFINSWPFQNGGMRDKIGAAFVSAGGYSAGEEHAMSSIHMAMLIHGMIIVGGPDWQSAMGASAVVSEPPYETEDTQGLVNPYFLAKGEALGKRIAILALRLAQPKPNAK